LLLASQSPRRRELLRLLGLPFQVTVADVAEVPRADETPVELVTRLSRAKAESAARDDYHDTLVIACDTIVTVEGKRAPNSSRAALGDPLEGPDGARVLGKPRDSEEAVTMLRFLRGRSHVVYSAVTVLNRDCHPTTELAKTRLTMRNYTESELATYVASGDPLDKAGAYAIQHRGFHPVKEIEGCYASVMGLPLCHLTRCLRRCGCSPTVDVPTACQAYTGHRCTARPRAFARKPRRS